jgi:hypothetical protein
LLRVVYVALLEGDSEPSCDGTEGCGVHVFMSIQEGEIGGAR